MAAAKWTMAARLMPRWEFECIESPESEGLGDAGQELGPAESAPEVVIRENDIYGAGRHCGRHVGEADHAHVRGQRHVHFATNGRHAFDAGCGILEVLQNAVQFLAHPDGGFHGPGAVGIDAERQVGEFRTEGQDGRDLLLRREDAGFQFECAETVMVHHGSGLFHNPGRIQGRTPGVVRLAGVTRPLVEKVPAELHRLTHGATQKVADRPAEQLALDIQGSDVECGQNAVNQCWNR